MHQLVDFKILNPSHLTISMQDLHIVLSTLQYSYVHGVEKENLSNNQKFLEVIIISVILVTLKLASRVMLLEEIRCLSLRGVN